MSTKIIPLDDYVVVEVLKTQERVSAGGIVIPIQAGKHRDLLKGKVVAAGPGRTSEYGARVAVTVKEGDIVLFSRGGGDAVFTDDERELRTMRCVEIRAKVEESALVLPETGKIVIA